MNASHRTLGSTGLTTSILGLGVEHLKKVSKNTVREIMETAIHGNINYVDLVWSLPHIVKGVAEAIETTDKKIITTVHLGSAHKNGEYHRQGNPKNA